MWWLIKFMSSNLSRTLKVMRDEGYTCDVVERFIHQIRIRKDAFGFIDMIALKPNEIIAVQVCSYSSHGTHRKKLLALENTKLWLQAGGKIQIRSWRKIKNKWQERIQEINYDNISKK